MDDEYSDTALTVLEEQADATIRRAEIDGVVYFSVIDVTAILTDSSDAGAYWRKLKQRLKEEGSEVVTNCHALKLQAADGKYYRTDAADLETMLRIVQSVPSPKAEPIKQWLAKVGAKEMTSRVIEVASASLPEERSAVAIAWDKNRLMVTYSLGLIGLRNWLSSIDNKLVWRVAYALSKR